MHSGCCFSATVAKHIRRQSIRKRVKISKQANLQRKSQDSYRLGNRNSCGGGGKDTWFQKTGRFIGLNHDRTKTARETGDSYSFQGGG